MNLFQIHLPISDVDTLVFLPPAVAFLISFLTSMGSISRAFLLLPFQVNVLGFVSPAATSTNFLYNVIGTPGGVLSYLREKRLAWPLAAGILCGALPGVLIGYYVRTRFLPDPRTFKLFVGVVLLCIGTRLLKSLRSRPAHTIIHGKGFCTSDSSFGLRLASFVFRGQRFCFSVPAVWLVSLAVGIIGDIYGIDGGAIIAPFCVSILKIPVHGVAGAVLLANFMTSLAGVGFYSMIPFNHGQAFPPDWLLGLLLGIGGFAGMYFGGKCQRFMPENLIKLMLSGIIFTVSAKYIWQFF